MSATSAKAISLKGGFIRKEAEASSAITPGYLVEFGGAHDLQAHSTAHGAARRAFAIENDLIGKGIDDAYASGDNVEYGVFEPGAEVYAFLAYGQNAAKGSPLVSNGDGTLAVRATQTQDAEIVAWAMEAINNNSGGVAVRIVAEVA